MRKTFLGGTALAAASIGLATGAVGLLLVEREQKPAQNIERDTAALAASQLRSQNGDTSKMFVGGREVRRMDGSGNNESDTEAGAAFQPFQRMTFADYSDDISAMSGPLRENPRVVSNIVIAQGDASHPNDFGTSDFLWQWGQFMDHDITLGDGVLSEDRSFDIEVPAGDPFFDPVALGGKTIHFDRAIFDPLTGTDADNPREQLNEITSWIDGSMVYGSSDERANALRTNDGTGRLKTSPGALLPFNTMGLPNADGDRPNPEHLFVAGDVRSNEQVGLTVMHTLFVREHNRRARQIRRMRPDFTGDEVFEMARRLVVAEIQIITFNEFLPALIGPDAIPSYGGYAPGNGTIFTEFSGAAYRLGHTLINPQLMRLNAKGKEIADGHLALRDAFFNAPSLLKRRNDIDPILRGLASQRSQRFDNLVIDDLRNFLFGPPGAGGFDLASLNIQRGRDRGIPAYNDVREALGFGRASDFADITSDPDLQQKLFEAYGSVDEVDLWVGGLSEDAMANTGSQLGPLFTKIVADQFIALRDHDRFWWKRDLTKAEKAMVRRTRLSDVIVRNTKIKRNQIPENVFYVQQ